MVKLIPCSLADAQKYVREHHRHSLPPIAHKFSVMVGDDVRICGVGMASVPRARMLDDGYTLEIIRVCTDGSANACSMLYGALRRACVALGYTRVVTYIRADEPGTSVRAAGFAFDGVTDGMRDWDTPSRRRGPAEYELVNRHRYVWRAHSRTN